MLAGLRAWVECESPTRDAAAVERMMDLAARDLRHGSDGRAHRRADGLRRLRPRHAARIRRRRARHPGAGPSRHGASGRHARALPWRREGDGRYGPGILDMKGGNFSRSRRCASCARVRVATRCRSPSCSPATRRSAARRTRDLIEAEAARHRSCWCRSRRRADGGVVTGRYAIARFDLGRPAGRAMPAPRSPRAARRSARWPADPGDRGDDEPTTARSASA